MEGRLERRVFIFYKVMGNRPKVLQKINSSREWDSVGDSEKQAIGLAFEKDGEFW